jgi:hypothetical protein
MFPVLGWHLKRGGHLFVEGLVGRDLRGRHVDSNGVLWSEDRPEGSDQMMGLRAVPAAVVALGAIGITLIATAYLRVIVIASGNSFAVGESAKARAVWEEAIRAKGGRERLRALRIFVTASHEEFTRSPRPDVAAYENIERLYILPNRFWEYVDHGPGKMGDLGAALDVDRHRVVGRPNDGPLDTLYDDYVYRLRNGQLVYLMETAQVQPEPVALKSGRIYGIDVDIVETRVNNDRAEFFLDHRTRLPVRIAIQEQRRRLADIYRLSDYHPVDGLQMPGNVHLGDDSRDKAMTTYRFNVDYDESVFTPGSVRFEKNGWMKR